MTHLSGRCRFRPLPSVALLAGAMACGCTSYSPPNPDQPVAVDLYVTGVKQMRAGSVAAGTATLERAVALNPSLRMAHIVLGDTYRAQGNYQRALPHYQAAGRLDPYTLSNQYSLGVTYQMLNRLQDAAAAYLRALKLNPRDVKTNMNLGLVYLALGDWKDAVAYLQRATELDPKNAAAWMNLGVALDASGAPVPAESTYRQALELDSRSIATLQNLSENLISQQKSDQAVEIMQQVVKLSDNAAIRKRFGDAYAAGHNFDKALGEYDEALKYDSRCTPALNAKANIMIERYIASLELDDHLRLQALGLWRESLTLDRAQPRVNQLVQRWEKPDLFAK